MSFPRWKIIFIVLVLVWGMVAALPNFLSSEQRAELPSFLPNKTLSLGLDLQGGVQMLLAAETEDVISTRLENIAGDVRDIRRNVRDISFRNIRVGERSVTFDVADESMIDAARKELLTLTQQSGVNPLLGGGVQEITLDREGTRFTLALTPEGVSLQQQNAVARAMEVIRRRVDPDGTRDVSIQPQGTDRIVLQVPGADNPDDLRRLIETAAKLSFLDVDQSVTRTDIERGRIPPGVEVLPVRGGGQVAVKKRVVVSGEELESARPTFDENGQPAVSFNMNTAGARKFGKHTQSNIGRPFAIVLDGEVISAPVIQSAILSGSGIINNMGDVERATELATLLSAGALPVPLTLEAQTTVGPDLGADSIEAGEVASIIGFLAVVVYMLLSYGRFGVAANIALVANLVLIVGFLSLFQATLTLPGIAGIVLTIGMAVDANVLIFERIREEQKAGAKPTKALETGYAEAFSTILDANITTFIAAVVLYLLGSGPVQGFAVTLGVGILTSMFTAILFTRLLLVLWLRRARPTQLAL